MENLIDIPGTEQSIGGLAQGIVAKAKAAREAQMGNAVATQEENRIIPAQDAPMVAMIERIAIDPNIPIDRLEKMMAMKERMEDRAREDAEREARKAYYAAMSRCQKALPVVTKTKRNDHTKSNYADLAAIEDQAMPIIHDFGFGVNFQPAGYNDKGELQIKWTISHEAGHSESDVAGIPVDGAGSQGKVNKTGTQAFGSTATYGRRYLLCMLFNISTGDDRDGNNAPQSSEPITDKQAAEIRGLIEQGEVDIEKFCGRWNIDAITDLPQRQYDEVVLSLQQRISWLANQKAQTGSAA
jgi:hypothetical protein